MDIVGLEIGDVKLIRPRRFSDSRGYFVETWNRQSFLEAGIDVDFVQDNASLSHRPGTIRGLHFQRPPAAQAKLIQVLSGSIFDAAVDLRQASPSYGRYVSAVISAAAGEQLYIPVGFAHGFCTLEPETVVAYKVSDFYSPEHDGGIAWDDPDVAVSWPAAASTPVLSNKDAKLPRLTTVGFAF